MCVAFVVVCGLLAEPPAAFAGCNSGLIGNTDLPSGNNCAATASGFIAVGPTMRRRYESIFLREANSWLSSPWNASRDDLVLTIMGSPFAGRSVTRSAGHTAWPGFN